MGRLPSWDTVWAVNPPGTLVQFEEARELVREQKLATKEKWQEWCDRLRSP